MLPVTPPVEVPVHKVEYQRACSSKDEIVTVKSYKEAQAHQKQFGGYISTDGRKFFILCTEAK